MVVNIVVTVFALGFAGLFGFWAQDRNPPMKILDMRPMTAQLYPGQTLKVYHEVERYRRCQVHLEHVAFDSQRLRITAPDEDYIASPGPDGKDTFAIAVPIPTNVAPGPASYRSLRSYYCNPLQTWFNWPITVITPEVMFEILPMEAK